MAVGPIEGSALSLVQPHPVFDGGVRTHGTRTPGTEGFSDLLMDAVARANAQSHIAKAAAQDLAAGRTDDIHGTMIELQKASIETKLVGSVKNKVVDAFYELWRMSV